MAIPVKPNWDPSDIERERFLPTRIREDLIEAILCDWDWSISRDEAEKMADKLMAARIAARIVEREDGK